MFDGPPPDLRLAEDLLRADFPEYAHLPLRKVDSPGTDNAIFRLGDDMAVRIPKRMESGGLVLRETEWLPRLPELPLEITRIIGVGRAGEMHPFPWAIVSWIEGEQALPGVVLDFPDAATRLGAFISAFQAHHSGDAPRAGPGNHHRGVPLAERDQLTRRAIGWLRGLYDAAWLSRIWDDALLADVHEGEPVWVHGDLQPGNLIARDGQLVAVIDFGLFGIGDPAVDLMSAWTFLDATARPVFREATAADDAAWARGRGWALSTAVIALAYYLDKSDYMVRLTRRTLDEVLADTPEFR